MNFIHQFFKIKKMSPYVIPGIKRSPSKLTIQYIIQTVCNYFEVTPEEINKRSRIKRLVLARQYSMYFMKERTDFTLKVIGKQFGDVAYDHTSVIHAVSSINNFLYIKDEMTLVNIQSIKNKLNEPF